MGVTKIQWAKYTWNPWWGCTRVSPGCAHCYAEAQAKRFGVNWGDDQPRRLASAKVLGDPFRWNAAAEKAGVRERVFLGSMMDWADERAPAGALDLIWETIRRTPWLDYLMLTKRPERIAASLPPDWGKGYPNLWLGTTTENQAMYEKRWPILERIPAIVRFLSMEPLLGRIDMRTLPLELELPDWIIPGGESGRFARPCAEEWIEDLITWGNETGTAVFVKQLGAFSTSEERRVSPEDAKELGIHPDGWAWRAGTTDPKGGDISEWPDAFQVRQLPTARAF